MLERMYDLGLSRYFEIIGSPSRGIVALRSRKHKAVINDPFAAYLVPTDDWQSANEIATLLDTHTDHNNTSIPGAAMRWAKRCNYLDPRPAADFRNAFKGGLQWAPHASIRDPIHVPHAVYSDIAEAYTAGLLRRYLPRNWEWQRTPPFPTFDLQDIDSLYSVSLETPIRLPWGFPLSHNRPGALYQGFVTGEELISAGFGPGDPDIDHIYGRWKPVSWYPHPGAKDILAMPKPLRKRIGNVLYGLHARRDLRTRGSLTIPPLGAVVYVDNTGRYPLYWIQTPMRVPFARIDHAAMTTARIRAAIHRAALSMDQVYSIYVDGIIGSSEPFDGDQDWLWPHLLQWKLEEYGECTIYSPGYQDWPRPYLGASPALDEISTR